MVQRITILCLVLATALSVQADTGWGRHTEAGEWAFARGNFDTAEKEFRRALEIAQDFPEGDVRLEESLRNLGLFLEHRSRIDEAEPLFLLWLAAQEHRVGTSSPELLDPLAAVARTAIPAGDHPAALSSLERFVEIADASDADDEEQLRIVLGMLARIYLIADRGEDAVIAQRRATAMAVANPGLDSDEHCAEIESLAQMELQFGDATAAEDAYEQIVRIRLEENPDADPAPILAAGAQTAFDSGEFDTAAKLAERALASATEETSRKSAQKTLANVAWMKVRRSSDNVTDLAAVEADANDLAAASEALTTLLADQSATLAPDHPSRIESIKRLTAIAVMQGDLDQAVTMQRLLVDTFSSTSGPAGSQTLKALQGVVDIERIDPDRLQHAADANAELLAAQETAWGPTDARLRPALELQYEMLRALKHKKQAKAVKKKLRKLD